MNSLLSINNDMNVFSSNGHTGERPLYDNLLSLVKNFPEMNEDIESYPLRTIAYERGEEQLYNDFLVNKESLFVSPVRKI